jgi:hypothetical protein
MEMCPTDLISQEVIFRADPPELVRAVPDEEREQSGEVVPVVKA